MDVKVLSVTEVSVFTTRSQPALLLARAMGRVPTSGWSNPHLVPHLMLKPPADGLWDFDFVATRPPLDVVHRISSPIGPALFRASLPAWCKGIRVHAGTNHETAVITSQFKLPEIDLPVATNDWGLPHPDPIEDGGGATRDPGDVFPWHLDPGLMKRITADLREGADLESTQEPIKSLVGKRLRVIYPGDVVSMDFQADRLNVALDERNVIAEVFFR